MNLSRLVKSLYCILPLLFIVISQFDMVKAKDVKATHISSLTVSSEEITDGGQTTVKFTFDMSMHKRSTGDALKVIRIVLEQSLG